MSELQKVIKYYQHLADTLPQDLENRELLYQKYQEYIEKTLMKEKNYYYEDRRSHLYRGAGCNHGEWEDIRYYQMDAS